MSKINYVAKRLEMYLCRNFKRQGCREMPQKYVVVVTLEDCCAP